MQWSRAVFADEGTTVQIRDSAEYDWYFSWYITGVSNAAIVNVKGNSHAVVDNAIAMFAGTQASYTDSFNTNTWTGSIVRADNVTVDHGTSSQPATPSTTTTTTFAATTSKTVYGSSVWPGSVRSETSETWQGYTTGMKYQATELWFNGLSALFEKTILSAKLRFRRVPGIGKGDDVNVVAYYGTRAYNSNGTPNDRVSLGNIGTLGNDGAMHEFTIPVAAINALVLHPTTTCLALNPGDSTVMSGKSYSSNYAKFSGVGSGYTPELVVTYNP